MRVERDPFGWSPIDHMNARRIVKPASGGKNYAKRDRMRNKPPNVNGLPASISSTAFAKRTISDLRP